MIFKLNLVKVIYLLTLIAGILAPMKITRAADTNSHAPEKQEQKEHHGIGTIPEVLTSKKAQQIEFFTFMGLIASSIVIPEFFYKPRKRDRAAKIKKNINSLHQSKDQIEKSTSSLIIIPKNTNNLNLITDELKDRHEPEEKVS